MPLSPFTDRFGISTQITGSTRAISAFKSNSRRPRTNFNPHATGYVTGSSSGSNTTGIDPFRQGVSITNPFMAQKRVLPRIWSGQEGNILKITTFGVPEEFKEDTPFADIGTLDRLSTVNSTVFGGAVTYVKGLGNSISYPVIRDNPSYKNLDDMNGIVEPFTIRKVASFRHLDPEIIDHSVKAAMMEGSQDEFGATTPITRLVNVATASGMIAFFDAPEHFGQILSGAVRLDDPLFEDDRKIRPYSDSQQVNKGDIHKLGIHNPNIDTALNGGVTIQGALSSMNPRTEIFPPLNTKVATSGFVFENPEGVDSIAFGGKRYYA